MAASKQTDIYTHACLQCRLTSVELAQAHPNNLYHLTKALHLLLSHQLCTSILLGQLV